MRKFDSRTVWTLTLIRNGKQEGDEDIRSAQFRFGRWTDEVTQSKPKRLPSGLRSMIEDSGLTDQAMESGIVISMLIATPSDLTGWGEFLSTVSVEQPADRWSGTRTRVLFSSRNGVNETLEFVDLYNPCIGGTRLPNRIWLKVEELPISTIAWAIGNGILEGEKSRQITLSEWIGSPLDNTIIPEDIISLPGPPSRSYLFHDSD